MPKDGALPQILQLVLDLSSCLSDLPLLQFNGVAEVAIELNDRFHDEPTTADNIESGRILANVVYRGPLCQLKLISRVVEVESVLFLPQAKE